MRREGTPSGRAGATRPQRRLSNASSRQASLEPHTMLKPSKPPGMAPSFLRTSKLSCCTSNLSAACSRRRRSSFAASASGSATAASCTPSGSVSLRSGGKGSCALVGVAQAQEKRAGVQASSPAARQEAFLYARLGVLQQVRTGYP